MGYIVRRGRTKAGADRHKILYVSFEGSARSYRSVPRHEWAPLGFFESHSLEELKQRASQLNRQGELARNEARRQKIMQKFAEDADFEAAWMPSHIRREFERRMEARGIRKEVMRWRSARKLLTELKMKPGDWDEDRDIFFRAFRARAWSASYITEMIKTLNDWGRFYARRTNELFIPLPTPRGRERERLSAAHDEREKKPGCKVSDPLTPELLESKRSQLRPDNYSWLYLAVWLGLRPIEIDNLADGGKRQIDASAGTKILWVYQSKLISVPKEKRWKPIPLFLPEQKYLPALIESMNFRRPLQKTMRRVFGESYTLYGGRKGFVDLMLGRGQALEDISVWLGHKSIERTWASYKDRQAVRFKVPA